MIGKVTRKHGLLDSISNDGGGREFVPVVIQLEARSDKLVITGENGCSTCCHVFNLLCASDPN